MDSEEESREAFRNDMLFCLQPKSKMPIKKENLIIANVKQCIGKTIASPSIKRKTSERHAKSVHSNRFEFYEKEY